MSRVVLWVCGDCPSWDVKPLGTGDRPDLSDCCSSPVTEVTEEMCREAMMSAGIYRIKEAQR